MSTDDVNSVDGVIMFEKFFRYMSKMTTNSYKITNLGMPLVMADINFVTSLQLRCHDS